MKPVCKAVVAIGFLFAQPSIAHARDACAELLKLRVPARLIGLPSNGARMEKAAAYPAEPGLPETCRVNGDILPATRGAPPIKFQINLPNEWNGKALQMGGGGFNGVLVDALRYFPANGPTTERIPNPLARGYATFGSDGGHQATNPFDSSFGRNPEARENYMGAAVKRLRDVAVAVIRAHYGSAPRRIYHAGGSKGGHEGLVAAQRYGANFDGVISYYPAKDSVGLIMGWGALAKAAYGPGGAPLSAAKQTWLKREVLAACDGLDGLEGGVIGNSTACAVAISPVSLACKPGQDGTGQCLTPAEVATLEAGLHRTFYPYPLANGVTGIGPFPVMSEADLEPAWISGMGQERTAYSGLNNGIVRDFWTGDPAATFATIDLTKLRETIEAHSRASDATSTELDAFAKHGGKLILVQGTTDMLVPPSATTDYYLRLAGRYGERTGSFVRYFVQPGYGHGAGPFWLSWDSLAALDAWVESGTFPANPVATDANSATRDRQMPLCEYPLFPRYVSGDRRLAASFRCSAN